MRGKASPIDIPKGLKINVATVQMNVKFIHKKAAHRAALSRIDALWDAPPKSAASDELEVLSLLVEEYEKKHIDVPQVDPISLLHHVMEARALTRKDIEPFIGSRARVAEVLNRVRPRSLEMIRRLAAGLNLPADLLIAGYALRRAA